MAQPVNTNIIQYISIGGSMIFLLFVLELIRKRKIKEEYSLLWLFFGFIFLIFSIWRKLLDIASAWLGIAYSPAALFLVLIIAIISILIHYSIVISRLTDYTKNLVQEIGLLKYEIRTLKKRHEE